MLALFIDPTWIIATGSPLHDPQPLPSADGLPAGGPSTTVPPAASAAASMSGRDRPLRSKVKSGA